MKHLNNPRSSTESVMLHTPCHRPPPPWLSYQSRAWSVSCDIFAVSNSIVMRRLQNWRSRRTVASISKEKKTRLWVNYFVSKTIAITFQPPLDFNIAYFRDWLSNRLDVILLFALPLQSFYWMLPRPANLHNCVHFVFASNLSQGFQGSAWEISPPLVTLRSWSLILSGYS